MNLENTRPAPKFLVIRFSSIGDIIQCMSIVDGILHHHPGAEIHWITRSDMAPLLRLDPRLRVIWPFDKTGGLRGLIRLARRLAAERFDYIYDAHANLRSRVLKAILIPRLLPWTMPRHLRRHKSRWRRLLLFRLRVNTFDKPFRGIQSYRRPLRAWGITDFPPTAVAWSFPPDFPSRLRPLLPPGAITLVPSANWEMKRWPVARWQQLVRLFPDRPFLVLAGPADTFCEEIRSVAPSRVINLAGRSTLLESCYLVSISRVIISADTGLLHAADLFGVPGIALMGPTAFGFPTGRHLRVIEVDLPCRPCTKDGRGKCRRPRTCMEEISADVVADCLRAILEDKG
jgi:heptosyltransferase-2